MLTNIKNYELNMTLYSLMSFVSGELNGLIYLGFFDHTMKEVSKQNSKIRIMQER